MISLGTLAEALFHIMALNSNALLVLRNKQNRYLPRLIRTVNVCNRHDIIPVPMIEFHGFLLFPNIKHEHDVIFLILSDNLNDVLRQVRDAHFVSVYHPVQAPPELQQLLVHVVMTRQPPHVLIGQVRVQVLAGDGQPGLGPFVEARVGGIVPVEWSTLEVSAGFVERRTVVDCSGVVTLLAGHLAVLHADFLAVVGDHNPRKEGG